MPPTIEQALELGLREAAEAVWVRKVLVELVGLGAPPEELVGVAHAHGKAIGRVEGLAGALGLIRGDVELGEELAGEALTTTGAIVWDFRRCAPEGTHGVVTIALARLPRDLTWSMAASHAADRPLYPTTSRRTP